MVQLNVVAGHINLSLNVHHLTVIYRGAEVSPYQLAARLEARLRPSASRNILERMKTEWTMTFVHQRVFELEGILSDLARHLDRIKTKAIQGIIVQEKEVHWLWAMELQDVITGVYIQKGTGTEIAPQSKEHPNRFWGGLQPKCVENKHTRYNHFNMKNIFFSFCVGWSPFYAKANVPQTKTIRTDLLKSFFHMNSYTLRKPWQFYLSVVKFMGVFGNIWNTIYIFH